MPSGIECGPQRWGTGPQGWGQARTLRARPRCCGNALVAGNSAASPGGVSGETERAFRYRERGSVGGISFSISDEQRGLAALAHEFAERELRPIARAVDDADV